MRLPWFSGLFIAVSFACGSSDATSGAGGGDAGDGRFHPPKNGQAIAAADACTEIAAKVSAKFQALSCPYTAPQCPSFPSAQTKCAQYDEGTVSGCVADYEKQTDCAGLRAAVTDCAIDCK